MSKFALLFILVYLGGLGTALLVDGAWGFYLYQLVYFLNPSLRWWSHSLPDISYSFIVVAIMGLAFLVRFKMYKENKLFSVPQTKWLLVIMILYYIVSLYALQPSLHWYSTIEYTKLLFVIALAYKMIDTPKKLDIALWSYILGAVYIGWEAYNVGRDPFGRVEGIGTVDSPDSNGIAAAITPAIPLLIYYAYLGTLKIKLLIGFCGVWIVNALVLINSRGSFIAVLAGSGYFILVMLFGRFQKKGQRLLAVFVVASGLVGALYLTDDIFWDRMNTLTNVEDERGSGSHRYHMWLAAIDVAKDYPGGVGAYGFQLLSPQYVPAELFFMGQSKKAIHSSWFQSLAELGWLGPVMFFSLISSCFLACRKIKKIAIKHNYVKLFFKILALECAFIAYLGAATFLDQIRAQILYWTVLFIACAYNIYVIKGMHVEDLDPTSQSKMKRA